jgi:branched-chain amino acid transport system substrate-binding protein
LQAALHGKPQAILLLSTTSATAEFTRQYRASGGSAQLIALSVNDASAIIRSIGVAAAQGLAITSVFPNPARSDLRILKEYRTALGRFAPDGTVPSVVSLEGFVVARVIVEALRRAGPNASRASLAKALESLGDTDLGGFVVDFGPGKRAGSQYVELTVISRHGDVLR